MTLHEKLIKLRKAVPYAQQDAQGYQYDYVSGTSLLAVLRPKMDELGVLLIPSVTSKAWTETRDDKDKKLYVVDLNMLMTWVDSDNPKDLLPVPFCAFGAQNDPSKAFGSALTYSERYFLLKFFNVPTDKLDPDAFQKKTKPKAKMATKNQVDLMFGAAKNSGWSKKNAVQYIKDAKGVESSEDLEKDEAEMLTEYFRGTPYEKSDGSGSRETQDKISKDQISKIWVEAKEKGWSNDDVHHEIHSEFDKESLTELTTTEASQLIDIITKNK